MLGRVEVDDNVPMPAGPVAFAGGAVAGMQLSFWVEEQEMLCELHAKAALINAANERIDATIFVDGQDVMATPTFGGNVAFTNGIAATTVPAAAVSGPNLLHTVGGVAAALDLSTTPVAVDLPIVPGTLSITVDVDGVGPATITDDGAGNLVVEPDALPLGGTIDYATGAMTGTTGLLTALSTVEETHVSEGGMATTLLARRIVRLPVGLHLAELRLKYTTGPVVVMGGVVPCELAVLRLSHNATLGHGVDSKVQRIQ